MEIFISHAHEDKALAKAWKELLNCVSNGQIDPWYSSDDRADGGVGTGNWREQIRHKLESADILLIVVTPGSNERPWLLWESGFAAGKSKAIIPIVYFVRHERIHSVFETEQKYDGESRDHSMQLCERIVTQATGKPVPAGIRQLWSSLIEQYLKTVQEEKTVSLSKRLFHKHFHNEEEAENLAGIWFARWTELPADGSPEVFWESDKLHVWGGETRLRIVGYNAKTGIEGVEAAEFYPMEGVVSSRGWVALSYWSGGAIPICGTCLLKPEGSSGDILAGYWQGYTTKNLADEPRFTRGRVVMSKRQAVIDTFFDSRPKP